MTAFPDLKLGKLDPTPDDRDLIFTNYRRPKLPQAQVGFDHTGLVKSPWRMLLNNKLGDCAIAGPLHETMLLNALAGKQVVFTDQDAESTYSAVTGYNPDNPASDKGSVVRDVLNYRRSTGLTDADGTVHKIGAYVALTPGDWDELLEALLAFETVGIGIKCPESAQEQFAAGEPWTVVPWSPILGGHYVPVVARPAARLVNVVTWGALQGMTQDFYETECDEAWGYISLEDLVAGKTIDGLDTAQLQADLAAL